RTRTLPRATPFPTRRSSDLTRTHACAGVRRACAGKVSGIALEGVGLAGTGKARRSCGALVRERRDGSRSKEWVSLAREGRAAPRSEEHTSELQSRENLVCRL